MSLFTSLSANANSLFKSGVTRIFATVQCRQGSGWTDWRMIKDYKKRMCVKMHAVDRIRLNTVKRNDVLPVELREKAAEELHNNFPRDSAFNRCVNRCMITSRPRGNVTRFRLSRIAFRHLADYNKLAGVQRAMW